MTISKIAFAFVSLFGFFAINLRDVSMVAEYGVWEDTSLEMITKASFQIGVPCPEVYALFMWLLPVWMLLLSAVLLKPKKQEA